ncbi:hypothetical protein K503DRAFT_231638 [Rhizopogon vinicolor AM-OR11-026]|uniref:Uncharacterized protein n=1 Tax=Rhizopogon vinicolor AM-OR11-026 TaxID=1314800 RepID=A0A1B7MXW5_9AGAM|nr:hypothetical protein K503DRAFT_231638 [Rhizopogon vinicolor AM-OR11-026]
MRVGGISLRKDRVLDNASLDVSRFLCAPQSRPLVMTKLVSLPSQRRSGLVTTHTPFLPYLEEKLHPSQVLPTFYMVPMVHLKGNLLKRLSKLTALKFLRRAPPRAPCALPTELYLLIFTYATAKPPLATINYPSLNSYYSSTLALCRVSRTFRHIALPFLLHTIFLSTAKQVLAFVYALYLQRAYMKLGNRLYFDYSAHVHNIWIGNMLCMRLRGDDISRLYQRLHGIDFSLLAPVLLASKSLALDYASLFLLDGCLKYAWNNSRIYANTSYKPSPLWSVKTLTLSGDLTLYSPTPRTAEGYAFLASLSHIIFFPFEGMLYLRTAVCPWDACRNPVHYDIPECLNNVSWDSLKGLQSISLALPHTKLKYKYTFLSSEGSYRREYVGMDTHIDLMTVSPPVDLLSDHWAQSTRDASRREEGRISSVKFCATSTRSGTITFHNCYWFTPWEQVWAYFMTADIRYN